MGSQTAHFPSWRFKFIIIGKRNAQKRKVTPDRAHRVTHPASHVSPMLDWVLERQPRRIVDAGCGSGRFAAGAVRRRPGIEVVAVDIDPIATLLTRATLAVLGAESASVLQADYTTVSLPRIMG